MVGLHQNSSGNFIHYYMLVTTTKLSMLFQVLGVWLQLKYSSLGLGVGLGLSKLGLGKRMG